jgi:hypothetical protein
MIFEDIAARPASTEAGLVVYRLSDPEFVIAHMSLDRLHLSPYHENTLAEVCVGIAHLSGYPVLNDQWRKR